MDEEKEPVQTRKRFERNEKYYKPEIEDKVVDLRKNGSSWEEITNIIKNDINEPNMNRDTSRKIYDRVMSRTVTIEGPAARTFTKHAKALDKMSAEAIKGLSLYVNAVNKLAEKLDDAVNDNSMDVLKVYGIFMKTAGPMKTIYSEMREFMKMEFDQQNRILIKQKDEIMSTEQILDLMKKSLDEQQKEGKLRYIKDKID